MRKVNVSRRRFLAAGIAGAAALSAAGWFALRDRPVATGYRVLDEDGAQIVTAIASAMLQGALPADPAQRAQAIAETVSGVDVAIHGLPLHAQGELRQLFHLLAMAPVRSMLARSTAPWPDLGTERVAGLLERMRDSRWSLLQAAYGALHQLVLAGWYGNPRAWNAIGYAGPPALSA